jgi:uncharacterized Ntn-hydrolase superfamily protein
MRMDNSTSQRFGIPDFAWEHLARLRRGKPDAGFPPSPGDTAPGFGGPGGTWDAKYGTAMRGRFVCLAVAMGLCVAGSAVSAQTTGGTGGTPSTQGESAARVAGKRGPLAHTFSIVARDAVTGEMGVAVQSHWFSVGSIVTWAEAGVGAVATQSFVDPSYGYKGLELMRGGTPAPEALKRLLDADDQREVRQVAMIDGQGRVSAFSGKLDIQAAGHQVGEQYCVQANMMENARVWPEMAAAFEKTGGDLADRMLAALDAAQRAGGDIRGKQSAAIVIVKAKSTGRPWAGADRVFDLRVDDHPEPIVELTRLVRLQRAYAHANRGDELVAEKKIDEALKEYTAAGQLAPEILELPFWQAVTLVVVGREAEAAPIFRRVFAKEPYWADLVSRLPAAGQLPDDKALIARIVALRPRK